MTEQNEKMAEVGQNVEHTTAQGYAADVVSQAASKGLKVDEYLAQERVKEEIGQKIIVTARAWKMNGAFYAAFPFSTIENANYGREYISKNTGYAGHTIDVPPGYRLVVEKIPEDDADEGHGTLVKKITETGVGNDILEMRNTADVVFALAARLAVTYGPQAEIHGLILKKDIKPAEEVISTDPAKILEFIERERMKHGPGRCVSWVDFIHDTLEYVSNHDSEIFADLEGFMVFDDEDKVFDHVTDNMRDSLEEWVNDHASVELEGYTISL